MSDYLWDGSGPPDPEVVALEEALGELRFDRPMPPVAVKRPVRRWAWLAAALAMAVAAVLLWPRDEPSELASVGVPAVVGPGWKVERLSGMPSCSGSPVEEQARLGVDEWLLTDASSSARLEAADIGQVEVAPSTRLRLAATGPEGHRLELRRGAIHVRIEAPPRLFVVEMPHARAVDLGCEYTLEVDEQGDALLEVRAGWVALEAFGQTAYVGEGMQCRTHERALGIPHDGAATRAFLSALTLLEKNPANEDALEGLLESARAQDRATLWHLLRHARSSAAARDAIAARLQGLGLGEPPDPPAVRRGDPEALDTWGRRIGALPSSDPVWR